MMNRLFVLLPLAALVGCQSSAEFDANTGRPVSEARLAAHAAQPENRFPTEAGRKTIEAFVLVDPRYNTIRIFNFSDRALSDTKVWINGDFMYETRVPAAGSVTLKHDQFYNAQGRNLDRANAAVNRVQLQVDDELYNVQGVATERR